MKQYQNRKDVPEKYKWDVTNYYQNTTEFKKSLEIASKKIKKIKNFIGCTKDPIKLYKFLNFDTDLNVEIMNLEIYAMMLQDTDLSDSKPVELNGMVNEIATKYSMEISFFEPELLSLSIKEYNKLFENEKLKPYKKYFDNIYRNKEHSLKENEQKIVSLLTQNQGNYSSVSSTLLNNNHDYGSVIMPDGSKEKLMSTNYRKIMKKLPREKRKKTFEQYNKVIDRYASTNASLLNDFVKNNNNIATLYNFKSYFEKKLFNQKISKKVYDTLTNVCIKNKHIIKKYWDLKAKCLEVDELMPWDGVLDLYKNDKEYSIEDAQEICLNAVKVLGNDYVKRFKTLIDTRAVDYCQYKGKAAGGYNVSSLGKKVSNIFMSFNYDLDSVSTLIHEGGHYTHHTYIYDNNELVYRYHSSMICEVASLTNECLLSNYLLKNGTKEEALAGLANLIKVFMSNLFGAVQEADLERQFNNYVVKGGTLTKDYLYSITEESLMKFYPYEKLNSEYQKCSWISRSHYYMPYYLISYAVCISVASFNASKITTGDKSMIDKYLKFLTTGSNVDIMDTFKILDVDLEDENVYQVAIDYFDKLLDEFEKLYVEVNHE